MSDPQIIQGVNLNALPPDQEMIKILKCFHILDYRTLITRDHEDDNWVYEYLGMHYGMRQYLLIRSNAYYFIWGNNILFSVEDMAKTSLDEIRECLVWVQVMQPRVGCPSPPPKIWLLIEG